MSVIKLRQLCPVITKGFKKELVFENPRVTLLFSTCHKSMVNEGKETTTKNSFTYTLPTYETVENGENILTLTIQNYDMNTDTNVTFSDVVSIEITPNNKNFVQREGTPCFSHHISEHFIDIGKYDTIIVR